MTQIAKRYLQEIEQICNFKMCNSPNHAYTLQVVLKQHWSFFFHYNGLFALCQPKDEKSNNGCNACLTQIRGEIVPNRYGIKNKSGQIITDLTEELRQDERIAKSPDEILPEHLRELTELTEEQKQEVRDTLMPYAEWQTRLRLHFKDYSSLVMQEV